MAQDFKNSLNMPKTDFPMRGNLPKREPDVLAKWETERLYDAMMQKNMGKPSFMFHDGPPYANGTIHIGTALNKVLKDFIVKQKNMTGYYAPYVPGWDTHGLPIELKALKEMGVENGAISPVELRKACKDFALTHVENQKQQFKRLGSIGDYDHPYLTLRPEYEARQIEVFGKMMQDGYLYKGLKPVYWCPDCNTALAEAEIEYENDPCNSIFVKFRVTDDKGMFTKLGLDLNKVYFVIWTTTTWTIPGNLAICLGPEYNYTLVKNGDEYYVMADELVKGVMETAGISDYTTDHIFTGAELEGMKTKHPLYDRLSPIIVGDHVTLESGTGCVHTAPGYGVEDFEVCKNYDDIGIIVCVDSKGYQTAEAGEFEGLDTNEANKKIAERLVEEGAMLAMQKIVHQYPHCWRCHSPIIYRATEQWFCSVSGFKDAAIKAIEDVQWIPEWGEDRIKGMVRDRSDWCISRQRTWGVPIPVVYCKDCHKAIVTDATIKSIADVFRKEGSDAWWTKDVTELIPADTKCECGCTEFTKEYDIMDVWFDSGVSHTAVLDNYDELTWPADLYLEGADQYRGWFQSSLLTSVVYKGTAPYKQVCTHGWVVDGEGKAMHKSLGNSVAPEEMIVKYGADLVRLWVASSDYQVDVRVSDKIFGQLSETYRKVRNTIRILMANLGTAETDFDPDRDMLPADELYEIDKWALSRLNSLVKTVRQAYSDFEFHAVYHEINNFCTVDMSKLYVDITKDRVYVENKDSKARRSAQTAMYIILSSLVRLVAPILSFTADEAWASMSHVSGDDVRSVMLNDMPEYREEYHFGGVEEHWNRLFDMRDEVMKALENARAEKKIGKSLDAKVTVHTADSDEYKLLESFGNELETVFIVSGVTLVNDGQNTVTVEPADGCKCVRCWKYSKEGIDNDGFLCGRCAKILGL